MLVAKSLLEDLDSSLVQTATLDAVAAFCRKWKVCELSLFGSAADSRLGPDSDVDVLVTLYEDAHLSLYDWVDMIEELKCIFGRDVDLLDEDSICNPFRRKAILSGKRVLYAA